MLTKLPLTWVISLGLVINELVINSIKYAFPDNRDGTIRVAFSRNGNVLRLLVEDDGVGVVGKVKSTGEGLPLLRAFSENLKWTIDQRSDEHGTSTSVLLPYDAEKATVVAEPHGLAHVSSPLS
jgi:two-component sensor histidine kinase